MLSCAAMRTSLSFASLLVASSLTAGCLGPETDTDTDAVQSVEQQATDPLFRVHNIVEAVLPAGNYDGVAGDECIALVNPEHRLRKIIIVETAGANGACALNAYSAGGALSFTWGDTTVYQGSTGIAAIRAALSDTNGAVHRLTGTLTSEATTLAHLQSFLTQTNAQQASQLATFTAERVHSRYDFEGQEQVYAEAAYQSVRVTQPCENPGSPTLEARIHNGFVYGYTASNTGSCHSGWFTRRYVYNRNWQLVDSYEYSE
ncbi:hypothetical protein HNV28_02695 [Myxococcus xanthus]|uniref:Lipoprotein n=2 Tax=Myxococcus xanthus TaxID=34 RepID=A0A7Y4IEA4_MYXXA|nr:hypothetical protein [Myxococcus xanthus]NOJ85509.1 hypothetical protein [Myxococcus xanthus]